MIAKRVCCAGLILFASCFSAAADELVTTKRDWDQLSPAHREELLSRFRAKGALDKDDQIVFKGTPSKKKMLEQDVDAKLLKGMARPMCLDAVGDKVKKIAANCAASGRAKAECNSMAQQEREHRGAACAGL